MAIAELCREELGLPLNDVQNAIKVLKSVGHLRSLATLMSDDPDRWQSCHSRNWSTLQARLKSDGDANGAIPEQNQGPSTTVQRDVT